VVSKPLTLWVEPKPGRPGQSEAEQCDCQGVRRHGARRARRRTVSGLPRAVPLSAFGELAHSDHDQ